MSAAPDLIAPSRNYKPRQTVTGDGAPVQPIYTTDVWGGTWGLLEGTGPAYLGTSYRYSFAALGTCDPAPYSLLNGEFIITPTINPTDDLDTSSATVLDGLATVELLYL
ncbi:hypothetical protein ACIPF8_04770 [Collimonas sp. NPDC087041]|uniref:hypothetical protein n=1 Tax=Collimonas sp. NPDC087041 TaxID=3363960 RepID=UPI0038130C99